MPYWTTIYVAAYWFVLLPGLAIGSWFCGSLLRQVVATYVTLVIVGYFGWQRVPFLDFETVQAVTDGALCLAFMWLAMRQPRWWLILIAALQMVACLGHLAKILYHPSRLGYALMTGIGAYPIGIVIMVAIAMHLRSRTTSNHLPASGLLGAIPKT